MEQLGYQAESGPWRNAYLTGAQELRQNGVTTNPTSGSGEVQRKMGVDLMLEYLGIRLDSSAVEDLNGTVNLVVTDTGEEFVLTLRAGMLLYQEGVQAADADAVWRMPKAALFALLQGSAETVRAQAEIQDEAGLLEAVCGHVVVFTPDFAIIEP